MTQDNSPHNLVEITKDDTSIYLSVRQDDIPVRGNASASGDDELDKKHEDEILQRLESGDVYAWFSAEVWAERDGITGESEYLGACSYKDRNDFIKDGYFEDMKHMAMESLEAAIRQETTNITEHLEEMASTYKAQLQTKRYYLKSYVENNQLKVAGETIEQIQDQDNALQVIGELLGDIEEWITHGHSTTLEQCYVNAVDNAASIQDSFIRSQMIGRICDSLIQFKNIPN